MIARLAAFLLAATTAIAATPAAPKNVILLVADGAGLAHWTAAKQIRGDQFRVGTMPVIGLVTTPCLDRAVTDSAAAASALATGFKVKYETVSELPDGTKPETVLEAAVKHGKATGVVTTTDFWDATPAGFTAHANYRHDPGLEDQVVHSGANVIVGTGLEEFGKNGMAPFDEFAAKSGYTVVTDPAQLPNAKGDKILAVFQGQDRDLDVPDAPLPMLAQFAIDHLDDDPDGFFLLIEHEGTDSSSHQNNAADTRKALESFDKTVGVALDFAAKRGDTLVIALSDHETGGLRISETKKGKFLMEWSLTDHTGTAVPLFAFGPGSAAFAGFQDNTDVGKKLLAWARQ